MRKRFCFRRFWWLIEDFLGCFALFFTIYLLLNIAGILQ